MGILLIQGHLESGYLYNFIGTFLMESDAVAVSVKSTTTAFIFVTTAF